MYTITYRIENMERLDKNSWLLEGFKTLDAEGFSRITIDNLCEKQKRSKGSFYYHFKNIDGYIEELMKYWVQEYTVTPIKTAEINKTPALIYKALADMVFKSPYKVERVIRAWGYSNPVIREYVNKVDKIRIDYMVALKKEAGSDEKTAYNSAVLEFAILIGIQQLYPDMTEKELAKVYQMYTSKIQHF